MNLAALHVSEAEAVKAGATHNGYLFGVPVWIGLVGDPMPQVAAKCIAFEPYIALCHVAVQIARAFNLTDGVPYYVDKAIGEPKESA